MKDGILILDPETGKVIDANGFVCALLGRDPDEILDKALDEVGLLQDSETANQTLKDLRESGYAHRESQIRTSQTEISCVDIVGNAYRENDRQLVQLNIRDISQRVKMERQIILQSQTIADLSRRKDEFLAMLSHELRNPLAPIRSALYLLKLHEESENQMQQQAREIIDRQVGNLTKLVGDLLEVSRVISGRIHLEIQAVDMNQIIDHALQTVAPIIERNRHVVRKANCDQPVWVNVDPTRFEEVLTNILSNAAKYTAEEGEIEISCDEQDQWVTVRIQDNGIGISEEVMPRIFDLFSQAERSLDRSEGGLGIGLSLAYRLVALHGGTIEAHSPPEGAESGSEFLIMIPVVNAPSNGASEPSDETSDEPKGKRVLVVDDNLDHVTVLSHILERKGYIVRTSTNGPDGFEVAKTWKPDIALLDIGLPGMNGRELARKIRSEPSLGQVAKAMKLIAISGYSQSEDIDLSLSAGFDAHITKPFDFDQLVLQLSAVDNQGSGAPTN